MDNKYACLYCGQSSILIEREGKLFLDCPTCGIMEAAPKLKEKSEELKKKQE